MSQRRYSSRKSCVISWRSWMQRGIKQCLVMMISILICTKVERIFWAWVEEWEEEARKKNDCVEEARLITKYRGLVFNDSDSGSTFSVWDQNMEFRSGRGDGWFVVGVSADKPDDESCNEPFSLEMACELIGATKQKEGVKVLQEEIE